MRIARVLIPSIALLTPDLGHAADPAPTAVSSERRLTPEQIQQVLDEAARKRAAVENMPVSPDSNLEVARQPVHGEVGVSIGTGGYRSAYGTAVVGLPGEGSAILSVGTERLPEKRRFYPYR